MKKGLRRIETVVDLLHPLIPTADLMKKGLRPGKTLSVSGISIPTADLMKKGLRLQVHVHRRTRELFQPQT